MTTWMDLDRNLKWNIRREPTLPPRRVLEHRSQSGSWLVDAKRGTRASGNLDLIVSITGPEGSIQVESLKQLVDDIGLKAVANREWMKEFFLPALIKTVAFGDDPERLLSRIPIGLPGYPAIVLLVGLQVIALTEHRKFYRNEPFGGKYLLVRVSAGLVWGVWSVQDITYGALMQDTVAVLRTQTGIREPALGLVLARSTPEEDFTLSARQLEALTL